MTTGTDLAAQATGSALFADISGFTPLTEALATAFGAQHGAEQLTQLLNQVYEPLIAAVHTHQGSVIGFSGDAITCWFPADAGERATAAALAMQAAMAAFRDLPLGAGATTTLTLKASVASGPVRRVRVGDP
ncbi:MAG TPA: adenylate/guanylate cyclase domain-containing protein, partial [Chloroflexia bacterium]|nr:adenylate/guanylate cyclase domain-containing protein [Chloroflexia bacterium]